MVFLPKNVADAIESCWNHCLASDSNAIKYITLNDWTKISAMCPTEYSTLRTYAQENPVNYMGALVNGYEVEFDKNMSFKFATGPALTLSYADSIKNDNYTNNFPIKLDIGGSWQILSIEEAKSFSDNINVLIQELRKVRSDI